MVKGPLIGVLGATGQQGGSVLKSLLKSQQHNNLRGFTRDPSSLKAKELAGLGVEVVQADMTDRDSLLRAFNGVHTLYVLTDYYDKSTSQGDNNEEKVGKQVVEAAKQAGVKTVIISALVDMDKATNGKYFVEHFTRKWRVAEAALNLSFDKCLVVMPGFYFQNFFSFLKPHRLPDGSLELALPVKGSTLIPGIDIGDLGGVVKALLDSPEEWNRQILPVAAEYISFEECIKLIGESLGIPSRYRQVDDSEAEKLGISGAWLEMLRSFEEFDYYGSKADLSRCNKLCRMNTMRDFLVENNIEYMLEDILLPNK